MSTDAYDYVTFDGFSPLSGVGPYRAADYWRLPEGEPIELIRGRFTVSPAPRSFHQLVSSELWHVIREAESRGADVGYYSPVDVVLDDENIVQPDLVYLAKDRIDQVGDRIEGPPSLVVEVLSPSTANRDKQEKLALYAEHAVPEYWIVDPDSKTVDFLINDDGRYVVVNPTAGVYKSSVTPELEVDLAKFWGEVDRRAPRGKA